MDVAGTDRVEEVVEADAHLDEALRAGERELKDRLDAPGIDA